MNIEFVRKDLHKIDGLRIYFLKKCGVFREHCGHFDVARFFKRFVPDKDRSDAARHCLLQALGQYMRRPFVVTVRQIIRMPGFCSGLINRMQRILKAHLLKRPDAFELRNGVGKRFVIEKMQRVFPRCDAFGDSFAVDDDVARLGRLDLYPLLCRQRKVVRYINDSDDILTKKLAAFFVFQKRDVKDRVIGQARKMKLDKAAIELVRRTIIHERRQGHAVQVRDRVLCLLNSRGNFFPNEFRNIGNHKKLFGIDFAVVDVLAVCSDHEAAADG